MVSDGDTRGPTGIGLGLWCNSTVKDCPTAMGTEGRELAFQCLLFLVFLVPACSKCLNKTAKEEGEQMEVNSTSSQCSLQKYH